MKEKVELRKPVNFRPYFAAKTGLQPFLRDELGSDQKAVYFLYLRAFKHADFDKENPQKSQIFLKLDLQEAIELSNRLKKAAEYIEQDHAARRQGKAGLINKKIEKQIIYHTSPSGTASSLSLEVFPAKDAKRPAGAALVFKKMMEDDITVINVPMTLTQLQHFAGLLYSVGTDPRYNEVINHWKKSDASPSAPREEKETEAVGKEAETSKEEVSADAFLGPDAEPSPEPDVGGETKAGEAETEVDFDSVSPEEEFPF